MIREKNQYLAPYGTPKLNLLHPNLFFSCIISPNAAVATFTFAVVGVCVTSALNRLELGKLPEPNFAKGEAILLVSYPNFAVVVAGVKGA